MDPAQVGFLICFLVNLVDTMGFSFTGPVLVPYGREIGASVAIIAFFNTVRFLFGMVALIWMPIYADRRGVRETLVVSMLGSALAYGVQGTAHLWVRCPRQEYHLDAGQQMTLWHDSRCTVLEGGDNIIIMQENATHAAMAFAGQLAGGLLECDSNCHDQAGVYAFLAGRIIAGLFGGTQPVLRSHVTQISPAEDTLKLRLTLLWAGNQAGNFALAPIAGLISRWGLYIPWDVCLSLALLAIIPVGSCFKNAQEIPQEQSEKTSESEEESESDDEIIVDKPGKDPLLWLCTGAYWAIFQALSSVGLLLPLLLSFPRFGLRTGTEEENRHQLAYWTSMAMIPNGLCNLLFSTFGYLILSKFIGDRGCMRLGAVGGVICLCIFGFVTRHMWEVLLLFGLIGMSFGIMVPAMNPQVQRYAVSVHPKKTSQASAIPLLGLNFGMVTGPVLFGLLVGNEQSNMRMGVAWMVAGIHFGLGYLLYEVAYELMDRHPAVELARHSEEVELGEPPAHQLANIVHRTSTGIPTLARASTLQLG
ncbi:unnamed protein product [Effrenium voratum]|nr:unnamed protein product [Effrenium voratum]|mmetsp:Transcript_8122/g.19403  ORF Transcript_8122/g.19403 Transcript_8122/m.19403 type:complete len:533 (+) Transcript_8122:43-1641(+)